MSLGGSGVSIGGVKILRAALLQWLVVDNRGPHLMTDSSMYHVSEDSMRRS